MASQANFNFLDLGAVIRKDRLKQIEVEIEKLAGVPVNLGDCKSMDTYCILEFAYSIPKRAHDIIGAIHAGIKDDRVVPVVILTRALLETTAIGCWHANSANPPPA